MKNKPQLFYFFLKLIKKICNSFVYLISFGSPQAIVINIVSIFLILASLPTKILYYSPVKCIFKEYLLPLLFNGHCPAAGIFTGCNCPACGITRAMSRLLHLDISGAIAYNIMVIPVFIVMVYMLIRNIILWKLRYKKTKKLF